MEFDTTVTIETNQKIIKDKMDDLYSIVSKRLRRRGTRINKKSLFTFILKTGLDQYQDESFETFFNDNFKTTE